MRENEGGPAYAYPFNMKHEMQSRGSDMCLPPSPEPKIQNMRCNEGGPAYAYLLNMKHEMQSRGSGMCLPPSKIQNPKHEI
jgi:hypothetical protein